MTLGHAEHPSHLGGPNHPSPTSRSMPPPPPPDVVGVGPEYEANPHIYMEVHDPLTSTSSPPRASTTSPRRHRSGHRQVFKIFNPTSIWSLITTFEFISFFHSSLQRFFTRRMTATFGQHFQFAGLFVSCLVTGILVASNSNSRWLATFTNPVTPFPLGLAPQGRPPSPPCLTSLPNHGKQCQSDQEQ